MLKLKYVNNYLIKVYYENNKLIGEFIKLEDGYFFYRPVENIGLFNSYSLKLIYDKLIELNHEWDEQIKNDLNI